MKKLIIAGLFTFGAATAIHAQDTTMRDQSQDRYRTDEYNTQQQDQDQQQQDTEQSNDWSSQDKSKSDYSSKDQISTSELPSNVQEELQSSDYQSWNVSQAYRKIKDGETFYAVELMNGDEKKMVKFDSDGNVVKEKDKKKDDQ